MIRSIYILILLSLSYSYEIEWQTIYNDYYHPHCLEQASDGGYIICADGALIKTNSVGEQEWVLNSNANSIISVKQVVDGGYVFIESEKLIKVAETTGEIENERKDKLLNHALNCTYKLLISTSEGNSEKKGELTNKFRETYKKISDKKNITLLIDGNNKNFQDLFPDDKSTYTNK